MPRLVRHRVAVALLAAALSVRAASAQPAGTEELRFPTNARPEAQRSFLAGLAWLHSFEYERALESFQSARALDPGFAMAYWGEAICYQQFLWGSEDPAAARRILEQYGPTPAARAARAGSPRERDWLAALDVLFGAGERAARLAAFADAMERLASADPTDAEAASFHGLALMATSSRGLAGAHHAGLQDQPLLAGSEIQERAASVFTRVLGFHPRHPGALHYLIHAYDDPSHAERALEAARVYTTVAPASSHARHMPAHVFVQLGRWQQAAAADEAAFAASEALVTSKGLPATMKDYHSLSWLVYEYLQLGRFRDARRALERLAGVASESREPALLSLAATLRARIVVESAAWHELPGPDYVNYDELFAVGLSAMARGDAGLAHRASQRLGEMATLDRYRTRQPLLEIMSRVLSAELRASAGDGAGAMEVMRQAVEIERSLPPAIGPPPLVKPAHELAADLFLAQGKAGEAEALLAAGITRTPNRSSTLLGRARAASQMGDFDAARRWYAQFLDNWREADSDRPELAEARAYLAGDHATWRQGLKRWWPALPILSAMAVVAVVARRRRKAPGRVSKSARSTAQAGAGPAFRKPARKRRWP